MHPARQLLRSSNKWTILVLTSHNHTKNHNVNSSYNSSSYIKHCWTLWTSGWQDIVNKCGAADDGDSPSLGSSLYNLARSPKKRRTQHLEHFLRGFSFLLKSSYHTHDATCLCMRWCSQWYFHNVYIKPGLPLHKLIAMQWWVACWCL